MSLSKFAICPTSMSARWRGGDLVTTVNALHDQDNPANMLKGVRWAPRPGGVYLAQDISRSGRDDGNRDNPIGTFSGTISSKQCMTVSIRTAGSGG